MDNLTTFLLIVSILSLLLNIHLVISLNKRESPEKSARDRSDRIYWRIQYYETRESLERQQSVFQSFLPLIRKTGTPFGPTDIMIGRRFFNVSMNTEDIPTERRRVVAVMKDGKLGRFVYTLLGIRDDGTTYHTKLGWYTQAELYELIQSDHIMVIPFRTTYGK